MSKKILIGDEKQLLDLIYSKLAEKYIKILLASFLILLFVFTFSLYKDIKSLVLILLLSIFFSVVIVKVFINDDSGRMLFVFELQKILGLKKDEKISNAFEPYFYDSVVKHFIRYSNKYNSYIFLYGKLEKTLSKSLKRKQEHLVK
ncbi:hypothetical protein NYR61_04520 [Actinobacillus genomosp. 1]|uniref:hypothetical protein n=1 Tax=Actinobacillus genomosp. 1 TaxID=254839 RepID=UPI002442C1F4|nr:hypothetical protein [Actinobacillus genomosp. 1]WGE34815.1 hypothetical protein NYR61_04520 [Actinobacillus genomosp. 1]